MASVKSFLSLNIEERRSQIDSIKINNPTSVPVLLTVDRKSTIPEKLTNR